MVRMEMEMPKDCANCWMIIPVKDGLRIRYVCRKDLKEIKREDLFRRQDWCPIHEDKPAGGTAK